MLPAAAHGTARVGFVFVCTVEEADPVPGPYEVKEITWMATSELRRLVEESPDRLFVFQLPVLEFYLTMAG